MQQNEFTNESEVELQDGQTVEESTETVEESFEEAPQEEAEPTIEERLKKAEAEAAKFRRLFEKSQKSQTAPKDTAQKAPSQINNNTPASPSIEEVVLKAQGIEGEVLAKLKSVAAGSNISLIDAQKDEMFLAWKEKRDRESKSEKARLGASRGSGKVEAKKTFTQPGTAEKDHYEMWKEKMGR